MQKCLFGENIPWAIRKGYLGAHGDHMTKSAVDKFSGRKTVIGTFPVEV